jgi:hypothetical protein
MVAPAVEVAADGEFGFNEFVVEAPIASANEEQAPVFEALTPTPQMVDAPPPAPVPWSMETMLNLAALLLVLGLGCSMLVPSEPGWSDDDDAVYVSYHPGAYNHHPGARWHVFCEGCASLMYVLLRTWRW